MNRISLRCYSVKIIKSGHGQQAMRVLSPARGAALHVQKCIARPADASRGLRRSIHRKGGIKTPARSSTFHYPSDSTVVSLDTPSPPIYPRRLQPDPSSTSCPPSAPHARTPRRRGGKQRGAVGIGHRRRHAPNQSLDRARRRVSRDVATTRVRRYRRHDHEGTTPADPVVVLPRRRHPRRHRRRAVRATAAHHHPRHEVTHDVR
jgi:hypothetical protein